MVGVLKMHEFDTNHRTDHSWLVVSNQLKKISQIGSFPQVRVVSNHHPDSILASLIPQTSALSSSLPCSSSGHVFLAKPHAGYTMKGSKP